MQVRYFSDTDTLDLILNTNPIFETKELDENTLLDMDIQGNLASLTIEHATSRVDMTRFSFEQVSLPHVENLSPVPVKIK